MLQLRLKQLEVFKDSMGTKVNMGKKNSSKSGKKEKNPLKKLIAKHESLSLLDNGKVLCTLTNHELIATKDAVEAHLQSKAFKKAGMLLMMMYCFDASMFSCMFYRLKGVFVLSNVCVFFVYRMVCG